MDDLHEKTELDASHDRLAKDDFDRGISFMESDKYDQAIAAFTEAIRLCSALTLAYLARAYAHAEQRHYDRAIADCSIVIGLEPENSQAYRLRARMHEQSGDWSKAERDIAKARQIETRRE